LRSKEGNRDHKRGDNRLRKVKLAAKFVLIKKLKKSIASLFFPA
jgi:hypothetical protein